MQPKPYLQKAKPWIIQLLLIAIVFFGVRWWTQRNVLSGNAPDFVAHFLDGSRFQLSQEKQRPILLHFWATWCPVCKLEQGSIESLAKDYRVVSVAMQSGSNKELQQFLAEEQLSFPVINDISNDIVQRYAVRGVPTSYIIDKNNQIKFVEVGYTTELGLRLRLWLANN